MKDRLEAILKHEGLSQAEFAEILGIQRTTVTHLLKGRNQPSTDVVTRIHQRFPFVNLSWLLTGEGEMCVAKAVDFPSDLFQNSENALDPSQNTSGDEYRKEMASESLKNRPENPAVETIKYIEMPKRNITEIRIFFDDNTFEIFKPEPQ